MSAAAPPVLVTGAAGFLGFHLVQRLLAAGWQVDGLDALQGAVDPHLQRARWELLQTRRGFRAHLVDLSDRAALRHLMATRGYQRVVHLAARVGVRESVRRPGPYLEANLRGFLNLLEALGEAPVEHLVYASSSSVYGESSTQASHEAEAADCPVSFYAATKRSNELMAHAWGALHGLRSTGLRLFTVYGPWGRPDMAVWRFLQALETGEEIELYDGGRMERDFTYVDDVVEAMQRVLERPPSPEAPSRVLNVGGGRPVPVIEMLRTLERLTGRSAKIRLRPGPAGDVQRTAAEVTALRQLTGFVPSVPLEEGLARFVRWSREGRGETRAAGAPCAPAAVSRAAGQSSSP